MDSLILLAQTCLTFYLAAWLFTGVRDNLLFPDMNGSAISAVVSMERLRELYPEDFKQMEHRAITSPGLQKVLFRLIVFCESIACLLLIGASLWMAAALFGLADPASAKIAAMAASLAFTSIWAGFLIVGNHYAYWMCHEWAQATHYQMLLWGIGTMIFLRF